MFYLTLLVASLAASSLPPDETSAAAVQQPEEDPSPPALPGPASRAASTSAFVTAGDLRVKCEDKALGMVSYCYAYVAGVHDSIKAYETWLNVREFCRPLRLSQSELRHAFLEYMRTNPEAAAGEAASVVVVALRQKYTCDAPGEPKAMPQMP